MKYREEFWLSVNAPWNEDPVSNAAYSVKVVDNTIYVCFRSTKPTITSWLQNFKFWKAPYKDMKDRFYVHSGFAFIYHQLRDDVNREVRESVSILVGKGHASINIISLGTSQGGAIATLNMEDNWYNWVENKPERYKNTMIKIDGYTFGSPRVVSLFRWNVFNDRVGFMKRIVYGNDIVTKVPWLGYKHIGDLKQIGVKTYPLSVKDHAMYWYFFK